MSRVEDYASLGILADEVWERNGLQGVAAEPDLILEKLLDWVDGRGMQLWPHQEEALMDLVMGDHVILGTPTGSGKSMVALGMHFMALCQDKVSYYTAPIKALVSEKFFSLVDIFGKDYVGMITGDSSINPSAPIICCTAEILANEALRMGENSDVAYVAMDEFHYYGDPQRGWAWQVPLLTLPNTQFLLMSATLGDTTRIASDLQDRTGVAVDVIADAPRPVPLTYEYVDTTLEGTVELALRKGEAPIYVVHFSQDAALNSAQSLASYGVASKEQREAVKAAMKGTSFNTAFGRTLQRLLGCGVGVHHAGMLPRYRLLVEKLAQQGLLPVICGTDTLGVGINVPIHTVLLTALSKFDGNKMRRLNAREFHQIAGRAGRSGFDTEGVVLVQAPEHEIENAKLRLQAHGDEKKLRKLKLKKPPEGFVNWNKQTFEKIIEAQPEPLKPRMKVSHSMVLACVEQGGDARSRMEALIDASAQSEDEKIKLRVRCSEVFTTLLAAGVVEHETLEDGTEDYRVTVEMPDNFALDQPLSPFVLAALELLDPESDTYAMDLVSMVEATVEDPRQVLRAQIKREKAKAIAEMKMEGVDYEERMERLENVTYPRPLEELLSGAFSMYCNEVPWANDYEIMPKQVLREMLETGATFKGYVAALGIARCEGILLRYLSDVFRVLARTIPEAKLNEQLRDSIAWLGVVVRGVDSSLVDEWANAGAYLDEAAPVADEVVSDRRGMTVLVRNALFARVKLIAQRNAEALGELDVEWGWSARKWSNALDGFYEEFDEVLLDGDARSAKYFSIDEGEEKTCHLWHAVQIIRDPEDSMDFRIETDVDLDASQDGGEVVFKNYRVGFLQDLSN